MIDPFRLCVALGPLALYCLWLGLLNMLRRPWLTTGARDWAVLGVAVVGLIVVGPLELFMPEAAAVRFGEYVWLLLLSFYGLTVSLAILLSRPRLVIYNLTPEQLRPILAELVPTLDPHARWAGDSISMPTLGVQFHTDSFPQMRNVSLVANGERQNFDGWRKLEKALAAALQTTRVPFQPAGILLAAMGLVLLTICIIQAVREREAIARILKGLLYVLSNFFGN